MKKLTQFPSLLMAFLMLSVIQASGQKGCETLLMNGVFNTFSSSYGSYSSAEWHNYWCSGTVERVGSSSSTQAALNVVIKTIPIGLSFDDAREFQRIYQSIYCGSTVGSTIDIQNSQVIRKVASPEVLKAYVDCKKVETAGLLVDLSIRPNDKKVFVVDVKFTGAWGGSGANGPKVKKVSFMPNVISAKEGSLADGVELARGQTYSMICERSTDIPVTVYVETEAGTFHADLPPFTPPPTDQEKVMAALPKGTILGWYDSKNIPKGWAICNGLQGTPLLIDKFPLGTSNPDEIGLSGGSNKVDINLTTAGWTGGTAMYPVSGSQGNPPHAPGTDHKHNVTGKSADYLPPFTKILFIMKL